MRVSIEEKHTACVVYVLPCCLTVKGRMASNGCDVCVCARVVQALVVVAVGNVTWRGIVVMVQVLPCLTESLIHCAALNKSIPVDSKD